MGTEASTTARTSTEESKAAPLPGEAEYFNVGYHIMGGIVQPASPFDDPNYAAEDSTTGGATAVEESRPSVA